MIKINTAFIKRLSLATCLFLLAVPFTARALDEREEKTLRGTALTTGAFPKTLTAKDAVFGSGNWGTQVSYGVKNMVKFEIDFFNTSERFFYGSTFTAKCNVTINCYTDPFNPTAITKSYPGIDLDINFNPAAGSTYKGIATYKFDESYKVDVVVNSVTANGINIADYPVFQLTNELIVTRQYNFNPVLGTNAGITNYTTDGSKLQLTWDPADYPGAESFDLEWTYIDDLSNEGAYIKAQRNLGNVTISPTILEGYFRNNSSRINLPQAVHKFNLNYNKGFVLFRIRGVQFRITDGLRLEGDWSYKAKAMPSSVYVWWDQGIVDVDWHAENLNWQYNAVFAEDGARNEVISYFDGSLRTRQSVTLNNADNTAVVAEPVYDIMGRAAMTVLPAPIASDKLQYYPKFNVNMSDKPVSYLDIPYASCSIVASPLKPSSGVEQYYSSSNPFMNNPAKPWNDAIPKSEGYPFSVTQYTADNTGRVKAQGGVGKDLQLGSGHETKYYYGKPSQYELDRLFGAEAGDHTHYLKNMVVDGNGQVSVSYVNSDGQTIATALAGTPPTDKVDALSSAVPVASVHDVIITPTSFHLGDKKLEASATFLVPSNASYKFTWRFTPELYTEQYSGGQLCYTCSYDLLVKITDECGNVKVSKEQKKINPFNISCTNPAELTGFMQQPLALGEYSVIFELTVNEETLDQYTDDYLVRNVDLKKFKNFLIEQLAEENLADCYNDCESCNALPEKVEDFIEILKTFYLKESIPFDQVDNDFAAELYNKIKSNCQDILEHCTSNPCQEVYDIILADVTPGGQYAEYDENYELIDPEINALAYYTQHQYYDEDGNPALVEDENGNMVPPSALPLKQFIQKFETSWATSLAEHHPEHCYYLWCTQNEASQLFNQEIEDLNDVTHAMDPAVHYFDRNDPIALLDKDPFFTSGIGSNYYGLMKDDLYNYSNAVMHLPQTPKNILETIDYLLYCGNANPSIDWDNCQKPPTAECRSDYKEWLLYKKWYLERKLKYYQMAMQQVMSECKNCFIPSSPGADPSEWVACVAPGKENFTVAVVENSTADGLKRIIIKYRGGNETVSWPLNVTVEMYNSSAQITQDMPVVMAPGFGSQEVLVPEGFDVFTIKGVVCAEILSEDGTGSGGRLAAPVKPTKFNAAFDVKQFVLEQPANTNANQGTLENPCDMPCPTKDDFEVTVRVWDSHYMKVCYTGAEICPGRSVTAYVKIITGCNGYELPTTIQVNFCAGEERCKEIYVGADCYALTFVDVTPACDVFQCNNFTCPTGSDFTLSGIGTNEIVVCYTGAPIPAGKVVSIKRIWFRTTCDGGEGYTVISPVFCESTPTCISYNLGNCIVTEIESGVADAYVTCSDGSCTSNCGIDYNSFIVRKVPAPGGWNVTTCYTGPAIPPGIVLNVTVDLKVPCGPPQSYQVSFTSTGSTCYSRYFTIDDLCPGASGFDVYGLSHFECSEGTEWQCPVFAENYSTSYTFDREKKEWKLKVCYTGPAIPPNRSVVVDVYVETGCDEPYYYQLTFCSAQPLCKTITLSDEEACGKINKIRIGKVVCDDKGCEWECPKDASNYTITSRPIPNTNKVELKLCYWGPAIPNGRFVIVNVTGQREKCEELYERFILCPGSGNCMTKVIDNGDCGKITELTVKDVECGSGDCPWECPHDGSNYDVTASQLNDGSWQVTTCYLGAPIPAGKRVLANVVIETGCGRRDFRVEFCSEWSGCQTRIFSDNDVCGKVIKGWVESAECTDEGCDWKCPEDRSNYIIRKKRNFLTNRDEVSVCYTGPAIPYGKTVVIKVGLSGCEQNGDYEIRFCQGNTCNTKILKPGCSSDYTVEIREVYCMDEPCGAQCPEATSFTAVVNGTGCYVPNSQQSVNINVMHPSGGLNLTAPTERVKVAVEITTRKLATFKKTVTVKYITFHNGDMSKDICFGYPLGYIVTGVKILSVECKGACPSGDCCDDPRYDLYAGKVRRFQDYVEPTMPDSFEDYVNGGGVNFSGYAMTSCKSECESMADGWILDLKNCTTDPLKLERIRRKLIDVCKQSCEMQRGNLTIQPYSDNNPYPSFESVIRDEFGGVIPTCSEDLMSDPYPWAKSPLPEKTFATETNKQICIRLGELKNEAAANGFGTSPTDLHEYLTKFYKPYYDLEVEDLEDLYQGCDKCDGIMKLPVELPLFMDGNAKPCKSCDEFDELRKEFDQKYPGIQTTDDKYEVLFRNFMNHKTGFSYAFANYADFMKKCDKNEDDYRRLHKLCETPLQLEVEVDLAKQCMEEKFFNAYSNAVTLYTEYIEEVKRVFRNNYTDKCLQANAFLETDAQLFEYHYTLYYYDQSHQLVKTIPPEGVKYLSTTQINQLQLDRTQPIVPGHRLANIYEYNSFNNVVKQTTADGGTSEFWYDALGRIIASQNSEQKTPINGGAANRYSYTKYEPVLGRVFEIGEKTGANPSDLNTVDTRNQNALNSWLNSGTDKEITSTIYDKKDNSIVTNTTITNEQKDYLSRKRVVATIYKKVRYPATDVYDAATHFSYDIMGNATTVWTESQRLKEGDPSTQGIKRMDYSFDLISGKVKVLYYQKGKGDQFIYKYSYDIENRLTSAMSSRDGLLWQNDARYNYYLHGPLARTELGSLRVQGVDNVYTLQGWIKYINGPALNEIGDVGRDGDKTYANSLNTFTSRDAMSYGVSYFDGEYKPIKTGPLAFSESIPSTMGTGNDIFTGGIRATTLQISGLGVPVTYSYRYDQLNRLVKMRKHETSYTISGPDLSGNLSISTPTDEYGEQISYDANGNIKTYERNGVTGNISMDKLTYQYEKDNGNLSSNKLRYIHDQVPGGAYSEDIDDQTGLSLTDVQSDVNTPSPFPNNYNYDRTGNLIHDSKEKIDKIEWNVYGKISKIIMSNLTQTTIEYEYDPTGNRIYKKVTTNGTNGSVKYTYYIRDASGNIMAIYDRVNSASVIWTEQGLYGSTRLGVTSPGITVPMSSSEVTVGGYLSDAFEYGKASYELINHLGNVLATVSDKKKAHDAGNGTIDYYIPDVVTANDYYPFGMTMPNRSYTNGGSSYNYGMNGQQKTKELGDNFYEALYWQYDSRIGRRWNVDPKDVTGISVYSVFSNNPIYHIDILGDSSAPTSTKEQALARIQELSTSLKQSTIWKNVSAADFVKAMQERVNNPTEFNQGHGTNFCWAAACMSYVYEKNPLGMVDAMFSLYTTGDFRYVKGDGYITSMSNPSPNIRNEPGSPNSSFKNDIGLTNKADQMLLLMLGGAFKCYLNTDRQYQSGDQDRDVITEGGWGASSLAKAHELWNSFGYNVKVSGTDIIGGAATVSSTTTALKTYDIVLFVNGPLFLHDNVRFKNFTGTHFIRVDQITNSGGKYNIHYWDYGGWKYRSTPISAGRFSDGTYGIIQIER